MSQRHYFGTDGIRGEANVDPLTPETVVRLGQAAATTLLSHASAGSTPSCVIGRDTRRSGTMLEAAMTAGLTSMGVSVLHAGILPTPAVALLTRKHGASAGVVISASHNPFHDNGIKFFGADGFKLADEQEAAMEAALADDLTDRRSSAASVGEARALEEAEEDYVRSVVDSLSSPQPFSGITIALDAAHGASYRTSPEILRRLGADVTLGYDEPNGININADCGATHPGAVAALVKQSGASVGISHDGDADRLILCDETGSPLDGDEVLAIAAVHLAKGGKLPQNSIAATVMSNFGLNDTLEKLGGKVVRTNVGDRYVMEAMRRDGLTVGGEQSGHLIFLDHSTTGDGIVAAVQVLQIMVQSGAPLSELRSALTKFPQAKRNLPVSSKPPLEAEALSQVQNLVKETESSLGNAGRVLLRYSGTEPKIRLLIEGRDGDWIESQADRIAEAIQEAIGT